MALIPYFYFDCVVAVGTSDGHGLDRWIGSGILVGRCIESRADGEKFYETYLVTWRSFVAGRSSVVIRFDSADEEQVCVLPLVDDRGNARWVRHTDAGVDIVAMPVDPRWLMRRGIKFDFFRMDEHLLTTAGLIEQSVGEGNFVYMLVGSAGEEGGGAAGVLVRCGAIARLRDVLAARATMLLIDIPMHRGGVGGAVILKPETTSVEGTSANNGAALIGIVAGGVRPVASNGLANGAAEGPELVAVLPVDYVVQVVDRARSVGSLRRDRYHLAPM